MATYNITRNSYKCSGTNASPTISSTSKYIDTWTPDSGYKFRNQDAVYAVVDNVMGVTHYGTLNSNGKIVFNSSNSFVPT